MRLLLGALLGVAGAFIAGRRRSREHGGRERRRYCPPDARVERPSAADHRSPPTTAEQARISAPAAAIGDQNTNEGDKNAGSRQCWTRNEKTGAVSAAATFAGAVFAAGALFAALEAVGEARRQANIGKDAYVASNRAWIDISVDPADISLKWREGVGATAYTTLEAVNKGNSPALETRLSPRLVVDKGMFDASPREVVRRDCKQWWPLNGGDIVFKDERATHTGPAFVPWYEIKAVLDRSAPRDAIEEYVKATGTVPFYFVACAMYRIAGDDEWHHTGRIYHVGRIDDPPDGERVSLYLKPGDDLDSDRLVLTNVGVGAYAD